MATRMRASARAFGTPLRCSQNNGGAQMTAMNTARKKGTKMELASFIPATTMIKLARINTAGALAVCFTLLSIGTSFLPKLLNREIVRAAVRVDDTETNLMRGFIPQLHPRFSKTLRLHFR